MFVVCEGSVSEVIILIITFLNRLKWICANALEPGFKHIVLLEVLELRSFHELLVLHGDLEVDVEVGGVLEGD